MVEMDKANAWRKFSQTGLVEDYLQFKNCAAQLPPEAKQHENEYRRPGAEGDGYRGK